jgi:hypothetical protein
VIEVRQSQEGIPTKPKAEAEGNYKDDAINYKPATRKTVPTTKTKLLRFVLTCVIVRIGRKQ